MFLPVNSKVSKWHVIILQLTETWWTRSEPPLLIRHSHPVWAWEERTQSPLETEWMFRVAQRCRNWQCPRLPEIGPKQHCQAIEIGLHKCDMTRSIPNISDQQLKSWQLLELELYHIYLWILKCANISEELVRIWHGIRVSFTTKYKIEYGYHDVKSLELGFEIVEWDPISESVSNADGFGPGVMMRCIINKNFPWLKLLSSVWSCAHILLEDDILAPRGLARFLSSIVLLILRVLIFSSPLSSLGCNKWIKHGREMDMSIGLRRHVNKNSDSDELPHFAKWKISYHQKVMGEKRSYYCQYPPCVFQIHLSWAWKSTKIEVSEPQWHKLEVVLADVWSGTWQSIDMNRYIIWIRDCSGSSVVDLSIDRWNTPSPQDHLFSWLIPTGTRRLSGFNRQDLSSRC